MNHRHQKSPSTHPYCLKPQQQKLPDSIASLAYRDFRKMKIKISQ
jgi:hypothetical protein